MSKSTQLIPITKYSVANGYSPLESIIEMIPTLKYHDKSNKRVIQIIDNLSEILNGYAQACFELGAESKNSTESWTDKYSVLKNDICTVIKSVKNS